MRRNPPICPTLHRSLLCNLASVGLAVSGSRLNFLICSSVLGGKVATLCDPYHI